MNYMVYVSHDAENLQFYLWLADYYQRFQRAKSAEQRLWVSPVPPLSPAVMFLTHKVGAGMLTLNSTQVSEMAW